MAFLGEQYFKMSNAIFVYDLTPIQLSVYFSSADAQDSAEAVGPA